MVFAESILAQRQGWTPDNTLALAGIIAAAVTAIVVSAWSHGHDRRMRQLEFQEQVKRREEERREGWLDRARGLAADARHALLTDLTPEELTASDATEAIQRSFDEALRRRFSLVYNFAPDPRVRQSALQAGNRMIMFLSRAGAASRLDESHPRRSAAVDRVHRAYGEAQYALDQLVEVLGGPPAPNRDSYMWALEDD